MSTMDDLIAGWQRRIGILQQENGLMEIGKMRTGGIEIVNGRISQKDSTEESIKRNKEWISQFEKLIVSCESKK